MKKIILLGFCIMTIFSCSDNLEDIEYEVSSLEQADNAEMHYKKMELFDCPSPAVDETNYYVCTNYVFEVPNCFESPFSPVLNIKIETSSITTVLAIFRKSFLQVYTEWGELIKEVQIEDEVLAHIGRNIRINASDIDVPFDDIYIFKIKAVYRSGGGVGNMGTFHNNEIQCRAHVTPLVPVSTCYIQGHIYCDVYYTCPSPNIYIESKLGKNKTVYTDNYLFNIGGNIEWKIFNDNLIESPLVIENQNYIQLPCGTSIVYLTFSREGCDDAIEILTVLNQCGTEEEIIPIDN